MQNNKIHINFGQSLLFVLGVILIMLKLAEVINWSWWIVLIPLYPSAIVLSFIVIVIVFVGFVTLLAKILGVK